MYHIIDTCYGQNLGLEEFLPVAEIISLTLRGEAQLNEWKTQILPSLNLRVCNTPLCSQDLEKLEAEDKITERFNFVLSLRFHNLHILLHRPILEKLLDVHGGVIDDVETNMMHQVCISSIENCVDSAMVIISIVHTVVLSSGWRRDLLGAWNYSLFYSKYFWTLCPDAAGNACTLTLGSIQRQPGHHCRLACVSQGTRC